MILDRPKRKAETIVGLLDCHSKEEPIQRACRLDRAIDDIGPRFNLSISKGNCISTRDFGFQAAITITAIVHKEPIRSRWVRAMDVIRDEYGLDLEWQETTISELRRPSSWSVESIKVILDRVEFPGVDFTGLCS